MSSSEKQKEKYFDSKKSIKKFLQKLAQGIIIPVLLLSFAALFLGLGTGFKNILDATLISPEKHSGAYIFPLILENIGWIIFSNLGLFFAIAIAITFTNEAGIAGFSAFVGWIVFNAFQVPFISETILKEGLDGYQILFYQNVPNGIVATNVGLSTLQTSLFGGAVVGFTVAWIYNKFHTVQLPTVLGFFSGTRLIPIITFLMMPILGSFFLLFYPLFAIGLNNLAMEIETLPIGLNSFFFGLIEKSLLPFGLQDAFSSTFLFPIEEGKTFFANLIEESKLTTLQKEIETYSIFQLVELPLNNWSMLNLFSSNFFKINNHEFNSAIYMQGNYPITLFALPTAGIAMILIFKKTNYQLLVSTIYLALLTTFLTGISEPLEFLILFLSPILYYGFHIWLVGLSFWIMNVLNANLEIFYAGGVIDFILITITESNLKTWPLFALGIVYFPLYYFSFYYYFKNFSFEFELNKINAFSPENSKKNKQLLEQGIDPQTGIELSRVERVLKILENLGGFENITAIDACFTRLRVTVVDKEKINQHNLKKMGALAVTSLGPHAVQILFGAEADRIKLDLLTYKKHLQI